MARFFTIDNYNTFYDWGLIVTAKSIPAAEPKTNYVEIDGRSGALDLSESLTGELAYRDRTMTASFSMSVPDYRTRCALLREITTHLHGRKVDIIEPDDPAHYYMGRVILRNVVQHATYSTFDMEAVCDPWRYAIHPTVRTVEADGGISVVLRNEGARAVSPEVTVEGGPVVLTFDGSSVEMSEGTYRVAGLKLPHGFSIIDLAGTGTVTFEYTEADL